MVSVTYRLYADGSRIYYRKTLQTEFVIIDNRDTRKALIPKFPISLLQSSISLAEYMRCIHKFLSVDTAVLLANVIVGN